MDRRAFRSKSQHLVTDPRSGEIKRIVHPVATDIGTEQNEADLRVFGTISGSVHHTSDGLPYLVAGTNVSIVSSSNGQVTITSFASGLSGSLTRTATGLSYLVAGSGMSVASASNGQVTVASTLVPFVGAFASRPSAGTSGKMCFYTDGATATIDDGSEHRPYLGSANILGYEPPDPTGYTWVNQGSATLAKNKGRLNLYLPSEASFAFRGKVTTSPAPTTAKVRIKIADYSSGGSASGGHGHFVMPVLRESSTGKMATIGVYGYGASGINTSVQILTQLWTSPTVYSASVYSVASTVDVLWLGMEVSSTNILFQTSVDNSTYTTIRSVAKTTAFTTASNQYGIGGATINEDLRADILSLKFD